MNSLAIQCVTPSGYGARSPSTMWVKLRDRVSLVPDLEDVAVGDPLWGGRDPEGDRRRVGSRLCISHEGSLVVRLRNGEGARFTLA
jgi:hypothetical protein